MEGLGLKPPEELSFDSGNISQRWKKWKKGFEFYLTATEYDSKSNKVQTSLFLTCIGEQGREIYETFEFPNADDKLKLKPVIEKFENYCNPRANTTIMRHKFFTHRQSEGQDFKTFVTELKTLSAECDFSTLRDSLIKDMIICGVSDNQLRERMLREPAINLQKAVELGHSSEQTKLHTKELQLNQSKIDKINRQRDTPRSGVARRTDNRTNSDHNQPNDREIKPKINHCKFCAGSHPWGKCPAYGKQCNRCKRKNHYAKCCPKSVDTMYNDNVEEESSPEDGFEFDTILAANDTPEADLDTSVNAIDDEQESSQWMINLLTNHKNINYKIDTGAQVNVLPINLVKQMRPRPIIKDTSIKLTAYNGTDIPVQGKCIASIEHKGNTFHQLFIIVKSNTTPIIGLKSCEKLNLIQRVHKINASTPLHTNFPINEFNDCFGEVGTLKTTYKIELKDDAKPCIVPPRKVPFAIKDRLHEELNRMEKLGVIEKVEKPTDWVNALVVVEKPNGKLRICLDPRPLNQAIKRQHYRLPTTEEILSEMKGANYFSKLDASNGYWQIRIDDESSDLLTFNTQFGRYKFNRMPFGIHSASEIFQREVTKIISGINGVANSQDDIIVWGDTVESHDQRLTEVLHRVREHGLKLNESKCQFRTNQLTFLGHIVSSEGIKPDPKKISAITNMPTPTNKQELQRFMGMVNYLAKFIPKLSAETAPLRLLLQKEYEFVIQKPQLIAIDRIKALITSAPTLQFYDPNKPTRLRTDASMEGLGAMLEQEDSNHEWQPIGYGSRSLDKAERNYCSIEREALSVLFGCEHFHEYLYGRQFTVQNDHQPLKTIFSKSITECPPRIQRFFLRLQRYDFILQYAPGKTMVVADTLSRASVKNEPPQINSVEVDRFVASIIDNLPISDNKLQELRNMTASDHVLQKVKLYAEKGWPVRREADIDTLSFYTVRDEIVYNHGLLLKGTRIIVPKSMQAELKRQIHIGHVGIESCLRRARQAVYWPGMSAEIKDMISNCSTCITHRNKQQSESLMRHEIPNAPWLKVASDIFTIFGSDYIIIVDYFSKFAEVSKVVKPSDTAAIIKQTKKIFSRHGIPKQLFSDNGPQYASKEFKEFAVAWDFRHDTSSPHYPRSNGLVERKIQTIKRAIKKAHTSGEDVYLALLAINTTPSEDGLSPAQKLFGRQPRTTLPSVNIDPKQSQQNRPQSNPSGKDLPQLQVGQPVRIRIDTNKDWSERGIVVRVCDEPRSYMIRNTKGNTVRRNRKHLLPTNEEFKVTPTYDDQTSQPEPSPIPSRVESPPIVDSSVEQSFQRGNHDDTSIKRTRYGRPTKPPTWFEDYET